MSVTTSNKESFFRDLAIAVAPTLLSLAWNTARDEITRAREAEAPCDHGRPGGRLCAACWDGGRR